MQSSLYKTRNKNKLISTDNLDGGCFIQTASIDADKITSGTISGSNWFELWFEKQINEKYGLTIEQLEELIKEHYPENMI